MGVRWAINGYLNGETNVAPKIGGLPMKPTTLSFLVGHLQKAPPFTATTAHHKCSPTTLLPCSPIHSHNNCTSQMRTNNASSLLLPIHSHNNCTSQNAHQQRFFLAPPHSQCALATTLSCYSIK